VMPESINPLGNYAVQILWQDGFNQVRILLGNPSVNYPTCLRLSCL
jgi:hypothetical protein